MSISIGDIVTLEAQLPYLKTADPMPMLRPPDLVPPGESGKVVALRAIDIAEVKFRRGTFLIPVDRLIPHGDNLERTNS